MTGQDIYRNALVWDMVWPLDANMGNGWDKLDRFRMAGYGVIGITLAGDQHSISQAFTMVAAARRYILARPDLVLVETFEDIEQARLAKKLAVELHFEGTRCFERDLNAIECFHKLGIRHTLLAFNQSNSVGGGCAEGQDGGLTKFGRRVVSEMERVGMLLDLSHTGYKTSMEALEMATKPVVFTHSNMAAVHPHFRNLKDDQALACAATGGLIGVSGSSDYLGDRNCSTEAVFSHLDYAVQLCGPKHVGLGLDTVFDSDALTAWARTRPDEWPMVNDPAWPGFRYAKPEQVLGLVDQMLTHGYAESAVGEILGENYFRIAKSVWKPRSSSAQENGKAVSEVV